jgi:hypothetical protein
MTMVSSAIAPDAGLLAPVRRCAIRIAGVTFVAEARTKGLLLDIQTRLEPFLVEADGGDTTFGVHYEEPPSEWGIPLERQVFDSDAGWQLYEQPDGYMFAFWLSPPDPDGKGRPSGLARFDRTFSRGELYQRPRDVGEARHHADGSVSILPWHRPFDELLLVNRIAYLGGVLIHGCGLIYEGRGHLFTGTSGAGKSTLASLWQPTGVPILSDERVIVRRDANDVTLHGTHKGSAADMSLPGNAPLASVNFIKQSSENYIRPLSPAEAVSRLLVTSFPTFYFKVGMENTVSILADVVRRVPTYEFGFRNDPSAVEFLLDTWGRGA